MADQILEPALLERVLEKLELSQKPEPTLAGLTTLYSSWCSHVPFDNIRKLIHVNADKQDVLPGSDAVDFFEAWLSFGAGGTCWAGNGALRALLSTLGFNAARGVCTMMVAPNLPPNHGTVLVRFDGSTYQVDASILHNVPLKLDEETEPALAPWIDKLEYFDGHWHILWRALHRPDAFHCRLDYQDATQTDFNERHEKTRGWSPFNYEMTIRKTKGNSVAGIANGKKVTIDESREMVITDLTDEQRKKLLIDEFGIGEQLVEMIPPDRPTPAPPDSRTARSHT